MKSNKYLLILIALLFLAFNSPTFSHSGPTDDQGCHEGWGRPHCH